MSERSYGQIWPIGEDSKPLGHEAISPELAPCPFCGNANKLMVRPYRADDDGGEPFDFGFMIACNAAGFENNPNRGCGAQGAWGETEADAITEWNRRSPTPKETTNG